MENLPVYFRVYKMSIFGFPFFVIFGFSFLVIHGNVLYRRCFLSFLIYFKNIVFKFDMLHYIIHTYVWSILYYMKVLCHMVNVYFSHTSFFCVVLDKAFCNVKDIPLNTIYILAEIYSAYLELQVGHNSSFQKT